jgi:molybdopterin-guanine dinucleotide biosynthesis protein MobB
MHATIIHIIGHSDSGKTMLIQRLVPVLAGRNVRVATVKHAHKGYQLDREGKDSWRHQQSGAVATMLVGPDSWALQVRQPDAPRFAPELVALAGQDADLVLVEGFRSQPGRRIQISLDPDAVAAVLKGNEASSGPDPELVITIPPADLDDQQLTTVAEFCLDGHTPDLSAPTADQ